MKVSEKPTLNKFGNSQKTIFLNIVENYFRCSLEGIDEYTFIAAINLTYHYFREFRVTKTSVRSDLSNAISSVISTTPKRSVAIFPVCDVKLSEGAKASPRFLEKFASSEIEMEEVDIFYRLSKFDEVGTFGQLNVFSNRSLLRALSYGRLIAIPLKVLIKCVANAFFYRISYLEKRLVFKALILFELNYYYFTKKWNSGSDNYERLLISNYYSPENLGAIKASLESSFEVIEIQHGVQNNVAAYQYKSYIPKTIKPTKFLTWFDLETISEADVFLLKHTFLNIKNLLLHGSGLNIIISLQPSNSVQFYKDLNRLGLGKHTVEIRPHPRRNSAEDLQLLRDLIDFDFTYDLAPDVATSLIKADVHLTEYSSCVLDGLRVKTPSICFHPLASEYFSDLLSNELLLVYGSVEEFLNND